MPPCARATVGPSWERSWPPSTKRCSVCLPSPDRELPSRGSLHSSRTLGSGLPSSTLFSLVLYVGGIVRGKKCRDPLSNVQGVRYRVRAAPPAQRVSHVGQLLAFHRVDAHRVGPTGDLSAHATGPVYGHQLHRLYLVGGLPQPTHPPAPGVCRASRTWQDFRGLVLRLQAAPGA